MREREGGGVGEREFVRLSASRVKMRISIDLSDA